MIIRIARIFMLALAFNLLFVIRPAIGDGSSPPNLSPDGQTNAKKTPLAQTKPQPSLLNKMSTGTKKFFTGVGDALTFKKTESKKTVTPTNPWIKPPKEQPKTVVAALDVSKGRTQETEFSQRMAGSETFGSLTPLRPGVTA